MHALPAVSAPATAPRRQLFVGTTVACAAGATMYAGMIALFLRFRQATQALDGVDWKPAANKVPEVATNNILASFLAVFVFAQWAIYAAKRGAKAQTCLALGLVALVAVADLNAQAFVWRQMRLAIADGTYQTMFYALTGTFFVLLIGGLVFSIVAVFRALGGRATSDREVITAHAIYWYFLGAIYVALWFVVYVTK
jgi:heme/copper-type cytochrome/quinol oxidase subunit 3